MLLLTVLIIIIIAIAIFGVIYKRKEKYALVIPTPPNRNNEMLERQKNKFSTDFPWLMDGKEKQMRQEATAILEKQTPVFESRSQLGQYYLRDNPTRKTIVPGKPTGEMDDQSAIDRQKKFNSLDFATQLSLGQDPNFALYKDIRNI